MLDLLESIKTIIERYIIGRITATEDLSEGQTEIPVTSSRRFNPGDSIVIFTRPQDEAETIAQKREIECSPNSTTLRLTQPLTEAISSPVIEKTVFDTHVNAVYVGDPVYKPEFPCITVEALTKENDWLTLGSTTETFNLAITVYASAIDYDRQYRAMLHYAKQIETSLFRSLYPLVQPYWLATLDEDVEATDTIITLTEETVPLGWVFFESTDYLRSNNMVENMGSGVYRLSVPVGQDFAEGDHVIRPYRHIYNAMPQGIEYADATNDQTPLKRATIIYTASEEVRRYAPYVDSLTF